MERISAGGEVDDATWDRVMRVNVTAPMRLIRAALPLLIADGGGSIVNVASEAALRGSQSASRIPPPSTPWSGSPRMWHLCTARGEFEPTPWHPVHHDRN
jgi:NAD(P)-dependent dehydrogenase (short-subunit alcohol dehydrogenase family)